jgi:hypothetical protein
VSDPNPPPPPRRDRSSAARDAARWWRARKRGTETRRKLLESLDSGAAIAPRVGATCGRRSRRRQDTEWAGLLAGVRRQSLRPRVIAGGERAPSTGTTGRSSASRRQSGLCFRPIRRRPPASARQAPERRRVRTRCPRRAASARSPREAGQTPACIERMYWRSLMRNVRVRGGGQAALAAGRVLAPAAASSAPRLNRRWPARRRARLSAYRCRAC